MEYFFILGRNPELSRAEIFSYLESNKIEFTETLHNTNFLVLDFKQDPKLDIQEFGGILKLGKILFKGNNTKFRKFLNEDEVVPSDKFSWCLFGNFPEVEDILIDKFKAERKKAMIRRGNKGVENQEGEFLTMANADFKIFCFIQTEVYFGLVEQEYSYNEIAKRDMHKPVRREELAISPRLAKILINLSQAKKSQTLLDPFCGIGVILQEALVKGINVIGVDIDKEAIFGAKENLKWLKENFKTEAKFELYNDNSKNIKLNFDCIASESSLGELLKTKVSKQEAEDIIAEFENNIIPILRNLKNIKKKNSKIAITFPFVRETSVDPVTICRETGLTIAKVRDIKFPIKEFRRDQFISRDIFVFE